MLDDPGPPLSHSTTCGQVWVVRVDATVHVQREHVKKDWRAHARYRVDGSQLCPHGQSQSNKSRDVQLIRVYNKSTQVDRNYAASCEQSVSC
jgi:hypothetical protein